MQDQLDKLKTELLAEVEKADNLNALEETRVTALGKKGRITELMKGLAALDVEAKKQTGAALNVLKDEIAKALDGQKEKLERAALDARLATETIDVSLPIRPEYAGRIHPISQTSDEIVEIFAQMGFTVAEGPDVEDDFHNFTALNIPESHPARQMHDTFYLPAAADGTPRLLRTHTSTVQIRTMLKEKPPIRIICPGRVYRSDYDQTHTPMFHQVEGLVIGENITMADLKGTLLTFLRTFFGIPDLPLRFRPSYFPFTEPSVEVDMGCSKKGGELKIGNFGDWMEILGAGMVHPKVLTACGIDPEIYQGFAFGMGFDRMAMLKYGVPDLRNMFDSDLRWLKHYGFLPFDVPSLAQGSL